MVGNSQKKGEWRESNYKVINTEYWEWWAIKEEHVQVEVKGMMCPNCQYNPITLEIWVVHCRCALTTER